MAPHELSVITQCFHVLVGIYVYEFYVLVLDQFIMYVIYSVSFKFYLFIYLFARSII